MGKTKPTMALEFLDAQSQKWMITRGFDSKEKAIEAMKYGAEQFSAPTFSRLRVRNMDTDAIVSDKIVIRRPPAEGEAHAKFDVGSPTGFLNVAFDWHTVH